MISTRSNKCRSVAEVLRKVPGAVGVTPDQIVGKGYLEITIDRQKAARYGVNVGDVQDVIEVALGGQADHLDRRGSRTLSGSNPLCSRLSGRRGSDQESADQRRGRGAMEDTASGLGSAAHSGGARRRRHPQAARGRCKSPCPALPTCESSKGHRKLRAKMACSVPTCN